MRDLIDRALGIATVQFFTPAMLGHESIYRAICTEYDDPNATAQFSRRDQTQHDRLLHPDLLAARQSPQMTLLLLRGALGSVVVAVEDEMKRAGLRDPNRPEREFLRHLRNASAHGNMWHFQRGEPRAVAQFNGFRLDASMHGTGPVLFDQFGPGDVYDLLTTIRTSL